MSVNSLNKQAEITPPSKSEEHPQKTPKRWWLALALPIWVLASFGLAQAILVFVFMVLRTIGIEFTGVNSAVLTFVVAAIIYALSVAIVIGLPWLIKKKRTTTQEIGLTRLPSWLDIALAPAGAVVYILCTMALLAAVGALIPGIDMKQVQDTGFSNLAFKYEFVLAFVTLIMIAPIFEEILFRGYLYGKLRRYNMPIWLCIIIVSVLFAAIHGQWNVALDVFALSIVLCGLREMTGSIWAGILLHMMKNSLAFYLLFVNPDLLRTMGG